jgi:hypothetical protein
VVSRGYDGIDIDYEKLPHASRGEFVMFLETLRTKLHASGKKLSVTVYAKTSDSPTWDGAGGHDYPAIGRVADSVKLMIYPYSYSGTQPGPISPLGWIDQVISYAKNAMPASKVIVGLPWYGKDWSGTTAKSISWPKAMDLAAANAAAIGRDANGEATFTYAAHTVFFNDAVSYGKKIDIVLARHPDVGGFAHWASGQEDPGVWTRVQALKAGQQEAEDEEGPHAGAAALVSAASFWRYLDDGSNQGTAWRALSFNDSSWQSGKAELGYGDYDEVTRVSYGPDKSNKHVTTYFRRTFDVADPALIGTLLLRLLRDDGAVVYLNGREVFRSNMPAGAIGYRTLASADARDESAFLDKALSPSLLVRGTNLIAVEIHQSSVSSSDLSFDLELLAGTIPGGSGESGPTASAPGPEPVKNRRRSSRT